MSIESTAFSQDGLKQGETDNKTLEDQIKNLDLKSEILMDRYIYVMYNSVLATVYTKILWHVYFMVKYVTGIFAVEILKIKAIQTFLHFCALPHGYIWRIYTTILSKIDRATY